MTPNRQRHDPQAYLQLLGVFMADVRDVLDDPTYAQALPLLDALRHVPEPRDPFDTPAAATAEQRDLEQRCLSCRAGAHNACRRGPCRCTHPTHDTRRRTR